ncbi:integrase core domain-containing protein [Virgibacillus halodenitrificans]|uniref:integrase core domain-containing protein n=1 Tax=Virgibacillus halodenitrificans TaxID=1482 RepID=UPI001F09DA73|nr:integrase core domain-containing protein [Virgibacillus halodenitrificans]
MKEMEKQKIYKLPKRQQNIVFKQLWVIFSKVLPNWKDVLFVVQPETVIRWHRTAFKIYWRRKSRKMGRPRIPKETIELIRKLHDDNLHASPEKLHEQLKLKGVVNPPAPNTIAKYIKEINNKSKPPTAKKKQSWRTFLNNHLDVTWAVDFFTIPTFKFKILHVLVIVHHQTRRIVHFNVTTNPDAEWVVQQFRNATPYGEVPKYLIHDKDPLFRANKFQRFLQTSGIQSKKTAYKSPWQNAYAERAIGTLKRECTDHIIPINEKHIHNLLYEYIHNYYNTNRPHQRLNNQTPIPTPTHLPVNAEDVKLKATSVMNGLYHTYKRVA